MLILGDDNPLRHIEYAVGMIALAAGCVTVFAWQLFMTPAETQSLVHSYGVVPANLFGLGEPLAWTTLFTSMFLHSDAMHLLGNMLFLYVLGDNVEDAMGAPRFIAFYLVCGIVAALTHVFVFPGSTMPMIGASGAVSGVVGAYLVMHPKAWITTYAFRLMFSLPAWVLLGFWILLQFFNAASMTPGGDGGVAWWAHIAGFVTGVFLVLVFPRRDPEWLARNASRTIVINLTLPTPRSRRKRKKS